jgi:hypothetical protein
MRGVIANGSAADADLRQSRGERFEQDEAAR